MDNETGLAQGGWSHVSIYGKGTSEVRTDDINSSKPRRYPNSQVDFDIDSIVLQGYFPAPCPSAVTMFTAEEHLDKHTGVHPVEVNPQSS